MSKSKFRLLIIMMAFSMVGIIWVQAIWIRNAYSIRNESFDNAVVSCLNNAAELVMSSQRMNFYNNYSLVPFPSGAGSANYRSIQSYSSISDNGVSLRIDNRVVMSGEERNPNSRPVSARRHDYLEWVKKRMGDFQNLSDQRIMEIYQWEKTLDINNEDIDNALKQTFAYAGIETPYEFAIIKNGHVQEGTFKRVNSLDFFKNSYMVRLFPGNIISQDVVLSVIFPAKTNYVLGQILWLLGGLLAFSLFIVATFGLSLFFIVGQK